MADIEFDLPHPLVMDMGSDSVKLGFSGDDAPRSITTNLVCKNSSEINVMVGMGTQTYYKGAEAECKRGLFELQRPVVNGVIRDLHLMEMVWHHAFYNELTVAPEEHPVLFTEHPLNPIWNRKEMLTLAMETFNIPGVYFAIPGVLNYYATEISTQIAGNKSGVFVDCGSGVTSIVPVHQGKVVTDAIMRQDWAGDVCTDRLSQLLQERGHASSVNSREVVEQMKLSTANVSIQPELMKSDLETKFWENPDGEKFDVSRERVECMEPIFSPDILDSDALGIHKLALASIEKCEQPIQRELCNRIVLSGGTTVCPGFELRFRREMSNILTNELRDVLEVIANPARQYTTWIGGSFFASQPLFHELLISKADYEEHGPDIAYKKIV